MLVKKLGRQLSVFALLSCPYAAAQEDGPIGTIRQPLVGGTLVSTTDREAFGLLTLPNGCSASMLNAYWAITAAHCVYHPDTGIALRPEEITLQASWPGRNLSTQALRVVAYSVARPWAPNDIALIQTNGILGRPDYRDRKLDDGRPGVSMQVNAFGRGINRLASGSGASATPTRTDGLYRTAFFDITGVEPDAPAPAVRYSFAPREGAIIAGGDSGGPAYVAVWDNPDSPNRKLEWRLAGVHSWCSFKCVPGQPCSSWTWVSELLVCKDASVFPVRDSILETIEHTPPDTSFKGTFPPPRPGITPAVIYSASGDGRLVWRRHDGAERGEGLETPGAWLGGRPVGRGWSDIDAVFGGGGSSIYIIDRNGVLKWYTHNASSTGAGLETAGAWSDRRDVGRGWAGLQHVFSGGNGIIYTIAEDGILRWYRHHGFTTGVGLETPGSWEGPKPVGRGWGGLRKVFSGGDGVIYAIAGDGILRWYNHKGFRTGAGLDVPGAWEGPKPVGRGWGDVRQVFSPGRGIIYAIGPDGILKWFKHNAFRSGGGLDVPGSWTGPRDVGRGWAEVQHVFALMPADPPPIR